MSNSIAITTKESNILFTKQASGPKFAKVGAVLFADKNDTIKTDYENGNLSDYTYELLCDSNRCTVLYNKINYNYENGLFTPMETVNPTIDNIFKISTSKINEQIVYSFDINGNGNKLQVQNGTIDMSCDGYALLGISHKPIYGDYVQDKLLEQKISIISIIYFPNDKLPLYTGDSNIATSTFKLYVGVDTAKIENLHIDDYKGFHLVDDGSSMRGI